MSKGANKSGTTSSVIFENFFDGFGSGGRNFHGGKRKSGDLKRREGRRRRRRSNANA